MMFGYINYVGAFGMLFVTILVFFGMFRAEHFSDDRWSARNYTDEELAVRQIKSRVWFWGSLSLLVCAIYVFFQLCGTHPYTTKPLYKIPIRQVGNANMFVRDGRSGNDRAKYQVLTADGFYKEYNASSTRIDFDYRTKTAYIQVHEVIYTTTMGKIAKSNYKGYKGYDPIYAYSIVVPNSSVNEYVRINY